MCKAFVKLPRPFGDQSGGARKWAIRAGCETWFHGGGYHPPGGTSPPSTNIKKPSGGKAKATARAKQLVIGTGSPTDRKVMVDSPWSGGGPSNGPAYDGVSRQFVSYPQPQPYQYPPPPPGYHYVPVSSAHHGMPNGVYPMPPGHNVAHPAAPHPSHPSHAGPGQPVYVPVWGPYSGPPALSTSSSTQGSTAPQFWSRSTPHGSISSPEHEQWREEKGLAPSEHGSFDEKLMPKMDLMVRRGQSTRPRPGDRSNLLPTIEHIIQSRSGKASGSKDNCMYPVSWRKTLSINTITSLPSPFWVSPSFHSPVEGQFAVCSLQSAVCCVCSVGASNLLYTLVSN